MELDGEVLNHTMDQIDDSEVTSMGSRRAVVKLLPRTRSERIPHQPAKYKRTGEQWKYVADKLNRLLCTLTILATAAFAITIIAVYLKSKENMARVLGP